MTPAHSEPKSKTVAKDTAAAAKAPAKYGIVVLLDALGTRTATIDEARAYLSSLAVLQHDVKNSLEVFLREHSQETLEFYNNLAVHFFGDSVLLIYDIVPTEPLHRYLAYLCSVLQVFYITALEQGILFRGAISIGEYLQEENVFLGPAINDAAAWYDQIDLIGTVATPSATIRILDAYNTKSPDAKDPTHRERLDMFKYSVPLKRGGTETLFAINWPAAIDYGEGSPKEKNYLKLYYSLIKRFPIPFGTESKFRNTEAFVTTGSAVWKEVKV
jgi:hypothetical protein